MPGNVTGANDSKSGLRFFFFSFSFFSFASAACLSFSSLLWQPLHPVIEIRLKIKIVAAAVRNAGLADFKIACQFKWLGRSAKSDAIADWMKSKIECMQVSSVVSEYRQAVLAQRIFELSAAALSVYLS